MAYTVNSMRDVLEGEALQKFYVDLDVFIKKDIEAARKSAEKRLNGQKIIALAVKDVILTIKNEV